MTELKHCEICGSVMWSDYGVCDGSHPDSKPECLPEYTRRYLKAHPETTGGVLDENGNHFCDICGVNITASQYGVCRKTPGCDDEWKRRHAAAREGQHQVHGVRIPLHAHEQAERIWLRAFKESDKDEDAFTEGIGQIAGIVAALFRTDDRSETQEQVEDSITTGIKDGIARAIAELEKQGVPELEDSGQQLHLDEQAEQYKAQTGMPGFTFPLYHCDDGVKYHNIYDPNPTPRESVSPDNSYLRWTLPVYTVDATLDDAAVESYYGGLYPSKLDATLTPADSGSRGAQGSVVMTRTEHDYRTASLYEADASQNGPDCAPFTKVFIKHIALEALGDPDAVVLTTAVASDADDTFIEIRPFWQREFSDTAS